MSTPAPTIMMRAETRKAEKTENAIPRCDEPSSLPSARLEPRKRLNPIEVVPTSERITFDAPLGKFGIRPQPTLRKQRHRE